MLSLKVLQNNGVSVQPICFNSYFFNCKAAQKACDNLNVPLRVVEIGDIHLEMTKSPKFGYGSAHNPCIDCHLMMLREAKKIMEAEGYDFLATGEVLGQRPMSQNANSLMLIEKELDLVDKIVRPLSLKLLPETEAEKKGLINRDGFYSISGRGRKDQIKLAEELGVKDYPTPAGGCILTEKDYGNNLAELFEFKPEADGSDCVLMRFGRVQLSDDCLMVIGRNQLESEWLENSKKEGDMILIPEDFSGPTVIMRPFRDVEEDVLIDRGIGLILQYSKKVPEEFTVEIR